MIKANSFRRGREAFTLPHVIACVCLMAGSSAQASEYPAMLDWSGRVVLTLPVSGVLESVTVQAGQNVKKGELLASIDSTLYKAGVAEARADMDRLSEEHADADRDLERVKELYARTVASTTELDAAKLRFARATSGLAAAQARVERARRLLAETELLAPFDAVILQRHAEPGLVISSQCQPAPVLTIARSDELIARAELAPAQAVGLRIGGEAVVALAEKEMRTRIKSVSPNVDHRYALELALPRNDDLMAGQAVSVRLP